MEKNVLSLPADQCDNIPTWPIICSSPGLHTLTVVLSNSSSSCEKNLTFNLIEKPVESTTEMPVEDTNYITTMQPRREIAHTRSEGQALTTEVEEQSIIERRSAASPISPAAQEINPVSQVVAEDKQTETNNSSRNTIIMAVAVLIIIVAILFVMYKGRQKK